MEWRSKFIAGAHAYTYDNNGNMLTDAGKGLTITYNLLDLPISNVVTGTNNGTVTYTYAADGTKQFTYISAADGTKLRKVSTFGTGSTTDYVEGIQYDATGTGAAVLSFVQTEEGRVIPSTNIYDYNLTDHLGNVRLSFDNHIANTATPVQQDDYMPFGIDISFGAANYPPNRYLINNKKELQTETTLYDYGARFYDPVTARWTEVDPLAEKYVSISAYVYALDNPIKLIDFEGGDVTPAEFKNFFLNYGVNLYQQVRSRGFSVKGAIAAISQMAFESEYAKNNGAKYYNNPFSLMGKNGKFIKFDSYSEATVSYFSNLSKHWPNALSLFTTESSDNLDKTLYTGKYWVKDKGYDDLSQHKDKNFDYGAKIFLTAQTLPGRFIQALDQGIDDNNQTIEKDDQTVSDDLGKVGALLSSGDFEGAQKLSTEINNAASDAQKAEKQNEDYEAIKDELSDY